MWRSAFSDLAGRIVRHWVEKRPQVSGAYTLTWAGEDQAGQILAPGIYLLEIGIDTDSNAQSGAHGGAAGDPCHLLEKEA